MGKTFPALVTKASGRKTTLSLKQLTQFFENASIGLRWVGPDGYILRANRAELAMLGYSAKEYVQHHISEFHTLPAQGKEILTRLAKKERVCNYETLLRCKDGSLKHVLVDATGLWENGRFRYAFFFDRDITERKKAIKEILEVREREQQRLGQDLHDGLCQHLIGLKFKTTLLERMLGEKSLPEAKDASFIVKLLNQAVQETYRLAHGLQPVILEAEGLMYALQELAINTSSLYSIPCVFHFRKPVLLDDSAAAIHLYRIAQEAISNALKHGKATRLSMALLTNRDRIILSIKDNGVGFSCSPSRRKGMGLQIMHYRARTIGAELTIRARPNGGTRVTCVTPPLQGRHSRAEGLWE